MKFKLCTVSDFVTVIALLLLLPTSHFITLSAENEKQCTVSYFVMVLLEDDSNNFHTYRTYEFVKTSNTFFSLIVMLHESLYPN